MADKVTFSTEAGRAETLLRLEDEGDGSVVLVAEDEATGYSQIILGFHSTGVASRVQTFSFSPNHKLGFKFDEKGKVVVK